jgi:hypothetical protein
MTGKKPIDQTFLKACSKSPGRTGIPSRFPLVIPARRFSTAEGLVKQESSDFSPKTTGAGSQLSLG